MPHKMMNSQIADVLHDNRLSIEARMLYAYLCSFDDSVPPSTYQMIRQLGIGKTRFYRYRNELEAFGLIEVENKITSGGGVAKYSFPDKPVPTAEAEKILITRLINNNNKYSKEETEDVIDNLQNKNQRLYVFTGLFYTYAPTKKQLDNQVLSIISAARQNSIEVSTYEYRQRQGFNSILPLGHNHCEISRMSTRHLKPSVQTPTSISPSAARASFPTKPASLPKRRPVSSRLRTSAAMRPFADRMKSPGKGEPI